MANENKANYIQYNWVSDDPNLISKATDLTAEIQTNNQRKRNTEELKAAFNVLLTSFDVQGAYSGWKLFIPTNNSLYSGKTRRSPSYTNQLLKCIVWLVDEGYLKQVAKRTVSHRKRASNKTNPFAYIVTNKLSTKPLSDPKLIRRNTLAGYIQLRQDFDHGKKSIEITNDFYKNNKELIDKSNKILKDYDNLMSKTSITLGSKPVLSAQTSLTRIFSKGSFELGGRLYSSIQRLKKETRPYLRFNNEPTVEIDYSAIHPTMLYNKVGEFVDDDPYTIDGFNRDAVKVAFNIMINRKGGKNGNSSATAIANESYEKYERAKRRLTQYKKEQGAENLIIEQQSEVNTLKEAIINLDEAKVLEKAIIKKHQLIKQYFSTGSGLTLQKLDSDIALEIISKFVEMNRPIITIHDSAIVSVRDTETLKILMNDCFSKYVGTELIAPRMKGLKVESLEYTEDLENMILNSLEEDTEDLSDKQWFKVMNNEPIQEVPEIFEVSSFILD